jgi:hypothetical protein
VGAGLMAGLAPTPGLASSHREAPLISADPQADNTDVYAFRSPDRPNTVTLISSWIPFEEPSGGPNFYPWAEHVPYDVKIDNNGDSVPDITYRWTFTTHSRSGNTFLYNTGPVTSLHDADLNVYQTYDLQRIAFGHTTTLVNDAISVPSNVGSASMPDFSALSDEGVVPFGPSGNRSYTWSGQSDDPFFLDLRIFDLLYGANLSEVGHDTLEGFNVNTLALQVPIADVVQGGDAAKHPVIGVWSVASRPTMRVYGGDGSQSTSGNLVRVSRLGNPLVNEVVIPAKDKDRFNASKPANDGQFLPYVQDPEVPHVVNALYGIPVPDTSGASGIQRSDLIQVFLTGLPGLNQPANVVPSEMLRLNVTTPLCTDPCSRLGALGGDLAGFPNGRRLSDDVVDIALRVVEGALVAGHPAIVDQLGDGVDANDVRFLPVFPYVAYAHSGSVREPHE